MLHFEDILQSLEPDIKAKSCRCRIAGMDSDDIAQELRIHIWQSIDKYNPKRGSIRTWANTIMRNKIINLALAKKDPLDNALDINDISGV